MQRYYAARFEREMGLTADDLRGCLPGACGGRALQWREHGVSAAVDAGRFDLDWQVLPDRRIALIRLPRLAVRFAFPGVGDDERQRFMRHFDLYTLRGGG